MMTTIHHGACKNEVTQTYAFCTVHAMGTEKQQVYPIGFCRENNKKGNMPCNHKTEFEAIECYEDYELEYFVRGKIKPQEILFPEKMVLRLKALTLLAEEAIVAPAAGSACQ